MKQRSTPVTAAPTPEQIADAIEILKMCEPISDIQGSIWFGKNDNFADATFTDYGACRAFAVAARALLASAKDQP